MPFNREAIKFLSIYWLFRAGVDSRSYYRRQYLNLPTKLLSNVQVKPPKFKITTNKQTFGQVDLIGHMDYQKREKLTKWIQVESSKLKLFDTLSHEIKSDSRSYYKRRYFNFPSNFYLIFNHVEVKFLLSSSNNQFYKTRISVSPIEPNVVIFLIWSHIGIFWCICSSLIDNFYLVKKPQNVNKSNIGRKQLVRFGTHIKKRNMWTSALWNNQKINELTKEKKVHRSKHFTPLPMRWNLPYFRKYLVSAKTILFWI